mmetsp:Transcript_53545/g.138411  ORF Transcript_53545/g.138411 Transcript_53545/m.138411 type:complete len:245 (-) Transcript_53545:301-1035(-)|eukprot:CAMPEP_0115856344 /NCGR_PEP_ID=MMETSP0287-20121206/15004_1 /TAXON_ID=412157 /ORGANISM="Chrysochromulina rotalis, Strain UIO044" /LENGTH=244 /DNA_ID=CAMNT_0003310515 /DNA_START=484 /DNA_END=1218 /DNA_ORIENTATION=+
MSSQPRSRQSTCRLQRDVPPLVAAQLVPSLAVQRDLLLFEVPPVLLVDEDQVEEVLNGKFVVHVAKCGRQRVEAVEEQPNGDRLASHWRSIHDLKLCDCLALVVRICAGTGGLALDDGNLHVLDLYPHQQEEDLAEHHVLQVILRAVVLELDVQAVLNPNLHLDRVVRLWLLGQCYVHPDGLLMHHAAAVLTHDGHAHKVPKSHVDAIVRLILFVDARKLKRVRLRALELTRRLKLTNQGCELV